MSDSFGNTVVPALEWISLDDPALESEPLAVPTNLGVTLTSSEALSPDGEPVLSRWGDSGILIGCMSDDGHGLRHRFPPGAEEVPEQRELARGELVVALTPSRMLGSFNDGTSARGPIEGPVIFSWPYRDINAVGVTYKRGMLGRQRAVHVEIFGDEGPVTLTIDAIRADESYVTVGKPDSEGFAAALVDAAVTHLLGHEPSGDHERLKRVLAGERITEGDESVAWLTDPDAK